MVRTAIFIILLAIGTASCDQASYEKLEHVEKTYPSGKKKAVTVFEIRKGEPVPVKQEYYDQSGNIVMKGPVNEKKERHGKWESFYKNDQLRSIGHYENGTENGEKIVYYDNGQKRYSGLFKDGKRHGKWRFWSEEGELIDEREY